MERRLRRRQQQQNQNRQQQQKQRSWEDDIPQKLRRQGQQKHLGGIIIINEINH